MKTFTLFLLSLTVLISTSRAERKHWAVLIAGSKGYGNYRHQADVCHAYHILKNNGIPDEQIIVMMYDDIAYNEYNPVKGNIINRPNGTNVYPGVPKDYTKEDVNANTFLKVLQGDKVGIKRDLGRQGKVLESGPDDYVFINFVDHGGPGILGMPNFPFLKARDLNNALKNMHKKKMFAKLTFYVEACESGSIFDQLLPDDINVYVTTAAGPNEPSAGCYCSNDRNTCLGDFYSVNWMQDADTANLNKQTLEDQFELVKKETNTSHVHQYGDTNFTSDHVNVFLGNGTDSPYHAHRNTKNVYPNIDTIASELTGIHSLKSMLKSDSLFYADKQFKIRKMLQEQLWIQSETSKLVTNISHLSAPSRNVPSVLKKRSPIRDWDCYEKAVDLLVERCPRMGPSQNDFVLRNMNVLVNLCNTQQEHRVMRAIEEAVVSAAICY